MNETEKKIVVIGGGTGSIAILEGLKQVTSNITAVVGMADDGGSNGVMRDELGVLPASDVWKCMTALSDSPVYIDMFRYRFSEGPFKGHTLGNMIMAAGSKVTGSFKDAVTVASEMLHIRGKVTPVTYDDVRLQMQWQAAGKTLIGEHIIDTEQFANDPRQATLTLVPAAVANPDALAAIRGADIIVIAPGDIYTSLGPQLIIPEVALAVRESPALKIYITNLVTKKGHTDTFTVTDHADEIERLAGGEFLDYVLYNTQTPSDESLQLYEAAGSHMVPVGLADQPRRYQLVEGSLAGGSVPADSAETLDIGARSLIRHDKTAITKAVMEIYDRTRSV